MRVLALNIILEAQYMIGLKVFAHHGRPNTQPKSRKEFIEHKRKYGLTLLDVYSRGQMQTYDIAAPKPTKKKNE